MWIVYKLAKNVFTKLWITCELCVNISELILAQTVVHSNLLGFEGNKFVKIAFPRGRCV